MSNLRRTLALGATATLGALALGAAPAAASPAAGVVTADFLTVTYTAPTGVANVVRTTGTLDNYFFLEDASAPIVLAGAAQDRCTQVTPHAVRCTSVLIATLNLDDQNDTLTTEGYTYLAVNGGAGNDKLNASGSVERPVSLRGEGGNDTLTGGAGDDILDTGPGFLQQIVGGAGSDACTGTSTLKSGCEL